MKIHEYQGKEILKKYGVPVPRAIPAFSVEEAIEAAKALGGTVWVVKAQIHAGGRGKGGGVKVAKTMDELKQYASDILGMQLITHQTGPEGQKVRRLLIEEGADIKKEYYLGMVVDRASQKVCVMASSEGGMDIEEVAEHTPELIHKVYVNPVTGLIDAEADDLAAKMGMPAQCIAGARVALQGLYKAFVETDADLAEINPLITTGDDRVVALDAKMNFDSNALYRHPEIVEMRDLDEEDPAEIEASKFDLAYISLDGNIGCLVNGAGLAMATMDTIKLYGGEPANFLDVGGGATTEKVTEAFKIMLKNPNLKAILVNIFGGIMKCDVIAEGVVAAAKQVKLQVPLVVRMKGTNEDLGKKILADSGLPIISADTMAQAAERVVNAAEGKAVTISHEPKGLSLGEQAAGFGAVAAGVGAVAVGAVSALSSGAQAITEKSSSMLGMTAEVASNGVGAVVDGVKSVTEGTTSMLGLTAEMAAGGATAVAGGVAAVAGGVTHAALTGVEKVSDGLETVAHGAFDAVVSGAESVAGGLGDFVETVGDIASGVAETASSTVAAVADGAVNVATGAYDVVVDGAEVVLSSVGGAVESVGEVVGGVAETAVATVGAVGAGAAAMVGLSGNTDDKGTKASGGFFKRFWWLPLLLIAGLFGLKQCGGSKGEHAAPPPPAPAAVAPAPAAQPAPAPVAVAPAAVAAKPAEASEGAVLLKVEFATGSAVIPKSAEANLTAFAEQLKKTGQKGEIAGHTDNVGNAAANVALSDARAKAVAAFLTAHGAAADVLTAKGYGDAKPIADNATADGKARNRRVEFAPAK